MTNYYDEPEPQTEPTLEEELAASIVIPKLNQQALIRAIAAELVSREYDDYNKLVSSTIQDVVKEKARKITEERVRQEIDKILEEGWVKTDSYGVTRNNERITLRTRISDYLNGKADSYSSRIDSILKECVGNAITKEFNPIVAEAKQSLAKQLQDVVTAKFQETLKTALGLK